jgi:hypothetical protein
LKLETAWARFFDRIVNKDFTNSTAGTKTRIIQISFDMQALCAWPADDRRPARGGDR